MIFDGWSGVARVLVVGTLAYFTLVVALRISGKRTLSKLNAFDLVVTVALGSTLATSGSRRSGPTFTRARGRPGARISGSGVGRRSIYTIR